jgi:hypothetical protein
VTTLTPSPPTVWFPPASAPPLAAGPVTVQDGHLAIAGQRVTFFAVNFDFTAVLSLLNPKAGVLHLDLAQQAVMGKQLDNLVAAGVRAVRIHGLDNCGMPNVFAAGGGATSTRQLDPAALAALDWLISALEARNLRYVLDLHYMRQLTSVDLPAWACPLFAECTSHSYLGAPIGLMNPWMFQDDGLMALTREYASLLLTHVNAFTQVPIGKSNGLIAVVTSNRSRRQHRGATRNTRR